MCFYAYVPYMKKNNDLQEEKRLVKGQIFLRRLFHEKPDGATQKLFFLLEETKW